MESVSNKFKVRDVCGLGALLGRNPSAKKKPAMRAFRVLTKGLARVVHAKLNGVSGHIQALYIS